MPVGNWDEIRTAYHVARAGTVSGAAEALGVHHATVIRHIDALEKRLGTKLFQRHARGYTPTEAGQELLRVAQATDDQLSQLVSRIRGQGEAMSGELIVTSLAGLAPLLTPALVAFQQAHPDLVVRFLTDERLFRLEYGEAHVAVRAGRAPEEPDNVVQPFCRLSAALYAAPAYAEAYGLPASEEELPRHRFVAHDNANSRAPTEMWLRERVPRDQVVFRAVESRAHELAVIGGAGLGFLPRWVAEAHPELIEVMPPREEWAAQLWLVTHVDLHRSAKVQALTRFLKEAAKDWYIA
ncbi:LysR family transcriptional regulator [Meinhardsimonia xiamenensis]|nr:LysR family transcriptional regulator [Meinhardsimonia xiamenensis]